MNSVFYIIIPTILCVIAINVLVYDTGHLIVGTTSTPVAANVTATTAAGAVVAD